MKTGFIWLKFQVPDQAPWRSQGGSLKYHICLRWSVEGNERIRACLFLSGFSLPYIAQNNNTTPTKEWCHPQWVESFSIN